MPPKDVCLYTNNDQGKQHVIVKQLGEEWKDGKCKTCVCENSYKDPKPNCLITECPNINDHSDLNDYILEEVVLDDKCCTIFVRTACKSKDKIYHVRESVY